VDEPADVADVDAEALGDGDDVDEVVDGAGFGHGSSPGLSVLSLHPPSKRVSATECDKKPRRIFPGSLLRAAITCPSVRYVPPLSDHHLMPYVDSRNVQTTRIDGNTIATIRSGGRAGVGVDTDDGREESVAYHRETVMGRADDHPSAALAYYASRGECRRASALTVVPDEGGSGAVPLAAVRGAASE
jgi:hypothetical protein